MADVTVRLFDTSGAEVATTVTDEEGAYEFAGLTPGTYHLEVEIPDGYAPSPAHRGPDEDDAIDSDIDEEGVMPPVMLTSAGDDRDWDAGLYRPASIGDLVWEDLDGDGIQGPGEPGLAGVTVRLLDAGGSEVGSTVTDGDGAYAFLGLVAGEFRVVIDIPAGYVASPRNRGSDDSADSDINAGGLMARTTLDAGEDDRDWDAGLTPE